MKEIAITGTNTITYPHLEIWNWQIAIYLYLGGIVAGLMVLGAIYQLYKRPRATEGEILVSCYLAPILSLILLMIGMFFIFLDLTRKLNAFWFYLTFNIFSPMSFGAWGIALIVPVSTIWAIVYAPKNYLEKIKWTWVQALADKLSPYKEKIAIANIGLGLFLGIYTGILLSSFVARPLWNSAILPILFLNSGLSTGAALLVLIARDHKEKLFFTKADIILIATEIAIILLFFYGHFRSTSNYFESIAPFFTTGYYFPFWISVFILGIFLPMVLVLDIAEVTGFAKLRVHVSALLVLIGGLVIRLAFVYVGQLKSLSDIHQVSGF